MYQHIKEVVAVSPLAGFMGVSLFAQLDKPDSTINNSLSIGLILSMITVIVMLAKLIFGTGTFTAVTKEQLRQIGEKQNQTEVKLDRIGGEIVREHEQVRQGFHRINDSLHNLDLRVTQVEVLMDPDAIDKIRAGARRRRDGQSDRVDAT